MGTDANGSAGAHVRGAVHVSRRGRLARALRVVPTLAALTLWSAIIGACGRSVFPFATDSPTPAASITTSPTVGNFLYSSNFADGKVAEFSRNLTTGALTSQGSVSAGKIDGPVGLANGPSANFLYVTNAANGNVRQFKINASTGALTAIGGGPVAAGKTPQWIAVTPNAQFAFVTNFGDGTISQYTIDATSGALTANGGAFSSALLKKPATAVASDKWLYVTDDTKGTIVSFPIATAGTLSAGTATALNPTPVSTPVPGPAIMDPTGKFVYVTDLKFGSVYFLTVGTGVLTAAASPYTASTTGEGGVAIGTTPSGNEFLFVANQLAVPPTITVFSVNGDGTLSIPVAPFPDASLNLPTGLIVDPTGSFLYVANQGNGTVAQFAIDPITGALSVGVPFATESTTSKPLFLSLGE
jgi:6-phosphogluconolactonase (cycloisomerase 2 family)